MKIIANIIFCLGGFICCLNFYLSFLHYPLYKILKKTEKYKWVSGLPLVGSLFVAISLFLLYQIKWILILGIILISIDTGGIHWFLGTVLYHELLKKKENI